MPDYYAAPDDARPTSVRWTAYDTDGVESRILETGEPIPQATRNNTWVEVTGLADTQWLSAIAQQFQIHPLAMEDILNVHHSPKLDVYANRLFVVLRLIVHPEPCETEQVCLYLGEDLLISFHEQESAFTQLIHDRILRKLGRLRDRKTDFLAYAIIDALMDSNYLVADALVERIERLDDAVAETVVSNNLVHSIRMLRHDLLIARRTVWPMRDVLNQLIRDQPAIIQAETVTFLKDCYDHTIQLIELVDVYREMCADLREYYLSMINLRSNEIMKVLTIIATIFIPLSFITGLYGMNFDRKYSMNMPELGWQYGYPFALFLMALTTAGMLWYFRRRHWL